jgi:hypothetical protein
MAWANCLDPLYRTGFPSMAQRRHVDNHQSGPLPIPPPANNLEIDHTDFSRKIGASDLER